MQIKCPKCGSEEYYTELKANNNVARCSKCDTFIKNVPYSEPTFYFGKYKNERVSEIEDIGYLKWALAKTKQNESMRNSIQKRIDSLEYIRK